MKDFKFRILVCTGVYPPEIGGPATYVSLIEKELKNRGIRVDVLPFRLARRLPTGIRHLFYFLFCFFKSLKNDIIYAQDPVSTGLPAILAAKLTGRHFIIRVAGDYAWEQASQRFGVKDSIDDFQQKRYGWRTELLRVIQRRVVNGAQSVITPSKYFQKLVSGWVRRPDKVKVIYNGIDLEIPNLKFQITNKSQISNNKIILSAGRLVPWKGFDVLIELMQDLPDWKLVIVGDGPDKGKLQFLISNFQLGDRVSLVGAMPRNDLMKLFNKASVFVLNTAFESFSFQVVEAMNAGVPVITTNIGNLAEIIENNKEGILVEPNNKKEILAAIKTISENSDFREMLVRNAKEKTKQFSISRTIDNLVKLINESAS